MRTDRQARALTLIDYLVNISVAVALSTITLIGNTVTEPPLSLPPIVQVAQAAPLPVPVPPQATTTPVVAKPAADKYACNCYAYVRSVVPKLPQSKYLVSNFKPAPGRVALMRYGNLPHYAIIGEVTDEGFYIEKESNYVRCKYSVGRFVRFDDPRYIGTWWSDDV